MSAAKSTSLHRHPRPLYELSRRYRHYAPQKEFRLSVAISTLFFFGSVVVSFFAIQYATEHAGNSVTDIVLSNIPVFDVDGLFVWGTVFLIAYSTLLLFAHPKRIPFALNSLGVFFLVRSAFIMLTHIGPFPQHTENIYNAGTLLGHFLFSSDL